MKKRENDAELAGNTVKDFGNSTQTLRLPEYLFTPFYIKCT